jgi:putative redox protein
MTKPAVTIDLAWTGAQAFEATTPDGRTIVTDGDSRAGLSPMELLAVATAGCMGIDVVHILGKARQPVTAVRVAFTGERAADEPRRFVRVRMEFTVDGGVGRAHLDRALQLSRDKYCSVWNSLQPDIALELAATPSTRHHDVGSDPTT